VGIGLYSWYNQMVEKEEEEKKEVNIFLLNSESSNNFT
jgi:hypothetical protein